MFPYLLENIQEANTCPKLWIIAVDGRTHLRPCPTSMREVFAKADHGQKP